MITANGGYLTKHAFGIYSSEPPAVDFQYGNMQAEIDVTPKREWLVNHDREVMIESCTVMYQAGEPAVGHAACLTAEGKRTWVNTEGRQLAVEMTQSEFCGRRASINGEGVLSIL